MSSNNSTDETINTKKRLNRLSELQVIFLANSFNIDNKRYNYEINKELLKNINLEVLNKEIDRVIDLKNIFDSIESLLTKKTQEELVSFISSNKSYPNYSKKNLILNIFRKYNLDDIIRKLNDYELKTKYNVLFNSPTENIEDEDEIEDTIFDNEGIPKVEHLINKNFETTDELIKNLENEEIPTIVKDNFIFKNPRKYQLETISKIYKAIEDGYKYIILEAPSGFGKSVIAATLSEIYSKDKTYILSTTRQLLNQYYSDFEDYGFSIMQPRSDFNCKTNRRKSCTIRNCTPDKCNFNLNIFESEDINEYNCCEYSYHLYQNMPSDTLIGTYNYFILENFYQDSRLEKRKLLICDEAHNIDEKISSGVSLRFTRNDLEKLCYEEWHLSPEAEIEHLEENEDYIGYLKKLQARYEDIFNRQGKYNKEWFGSFDARTMVIKQEQLNKFLKYLEKDITNIVIRINKNKDGNLRSINFKPIEIKDFIRNPLLDYCDVCIFMSSSIFDHNNFASDLDIDEDELYVLKVPNTFDLTKNPIKIYDNFDMNYDNLKENVEDTIPIIKEILAKHKDEKGIIHTFSDECKDYLKDKLPRIITHTTKNRQEQLDYFINSSEPLVLLSPSMNEGVDLPHELCRFQIIYKLPYLPISDERIAKRKAIYDDGEEWYRYKMITKLIQTYGRGIRDKEDYCKTYVLDNRLINIINEDLIKYHIIPEYFIEAIKNKDIL